MKCYGINIHKIKVIHRQEYELNYSQFDYCLYSYSQSNKYSPKGQVAGTMGYIITGDYHQEKVIKMVQTTNFEMSVMALIHGLREIANQHHAKNPAHVLLYMPNPLLRDVFTNPARIKSKSAIKRVKHNLEIIKLLDYAFSQFKVTMVDYHLFNDNLLVDKIKRDVKKQALGDN